MGRAIKLVLYYFAYQLAFTFLVGLPAGIIKVMNEISENDNLAYAVGKNTASMTGLVMVLAGIAMIWHLIYFKYVQFNKTSWTEVPAKTILLSIPFIIAAMFICNVASEFIELPNLVEDTFIGMSRNVFGIIAIAVMAPLVEELLFRGAIEGHFLQTGKKTRYGNPPVSTHFRSHPCQSGASTFRLLSGIGIRMALLPHRKHYAGNDRAFSK